MIERNYSIDILKFICATLIVFLHTDFQWHNAVLPLTRCAVPCFLMISGFLLYTDGKGIGMERLKRNIKHILHIIIWSTVLFAVIKEIIAITHGELFIPSKRQWLKFIIFNDNPFGFHLWYLGAYLYVLIIMIVVDKYNLWSRMLWCIPFLLFGDLLFGKYSLLLLNKEFPYICVRNFLFVGIPYFLLGVWLKINITKLQTINRHIYLCGIILFSITSIIEKLLLLYLDKNPAREHYLSTTFLAICLFLFVISLKNVKASNVSRMGERDSLYIYVFHPLFLFTLPTLIKKLPMAIGEVYFWIAPLLILVLTITLTAFLRKTKIIK